MASIQLMVAEYGGRGRRDGWEAAPDRAPWRGLLAKPALALCAFRQDFSAEMPPNRTPFSPMWPAAPMIGQHVL
ncbi:hypothetical protein D8I35_11500 [Corticibacter populi]|uniref:Uncharacterized protein n=1 Tax=Corticibacter populi TaxID=1550736 RepID=A0A3M6QTI3_9BURK|nr:hypothetical protein D8I35_11500 [Corticibacter populi]